MDKPYDIYKSNCVFDGCNKNVWIKLDNNDILLWWSSYDHGHNPEEQEILKLLAGFMFEYIYHKYKGKRSRWIDEDKALNFELVEDFKFRSNLQSCL